jgi:hypothetical protein
MCVHSSFSTNVNWECLFPAQNKVKATISGIQPKITNLQRKWENTINSEVQSGNWSCSIIEAEVRKSREEY